MCILQELWNCCGCRDFVYTWLDQASILLQKGDVCTRVGRTKHVTRLFKGWITLSTEYITIQWIGVSKTNHTIHWIVIYPMDRRRIALSSLWTTGTRSFCYFPPFTSFQLHWTMLSFLVFFISPASHPSPAQDKERAGWMQRKFHWGRLPASQPTSKRLPFDSLFVILTDRITLSYDIRERCCPLKAKWTKILTFGL